MASTNVTLATTELSEMARLFETLAERDYDRAARIWDQMEEEFPNPRDMIDIDFSGGMGFCVLTPRLVAYLVEHNIVNVPEISGLA